MATRRRPALGKSAAMYTALALQCSLADYWTVWFDSGGAHIPKGLDYLFSTYYFLPNFLPIFSILRMGSCLLSSFKLGTSRGYTGCVTTTCMIGRQQGFAKLATGPQAGDLECASYLKCRFKWMCTTEAHLVGCLRITAVHCSTMCKSLLLCCAL
jgi:hypothetical protein